MLTPATWLGVCGWPVAHSRSPDIQNAALRAAGLEGGWRYLKLGLPPLRFEETVRALPARHFRGVNVTIPHKETALALADRATATAAAVGAANTLTFEPSGAIEADNTDAPGLLAALGPRHRPGPHTTALVLGAGGAARAAIHALKSCGARVHVWNRTPERARGLADELGAEATRGPQEADLIVDCTSIGLHGDHEAFKRLPIGADTVKAGSCVVDMAYRPGGTLLLRAARAWGAEAVDGLEVLIGQGAASFERWTGRPADRQAMRAAVADIARSPR